MKKIKIRDSKTIKDSVEILRKKIKDAEFDLTKEGVGSIANALLEKKEEIGEANGFAELKAVIEEALEPFDTPKSREIEQKIAELERMYKRDPRVGSRNDYWLWEQLLKYAWNIILKASGNPSPDARPAKEEKAKDSVKDEEPEDSLKELVSLLGEAHTKIMEAYDLASDLGREGKIDSSLVYEIEDLEAASGELDFEGEDDPIGALLEKYGPEEGFDAGAEDFDLE